MTPTLYNAIINLKSLIDKKPNKSITIEHGETTKRAKWGKLTAYNLNSNKWAVRGAGRNELLDGIQKRILHTISDLGEEYKINNFSAIRSSENGPIRLYDFELVDVNKNVKYQVSMNINRHNYLYETFLVVEKL